ncbi:MAG: cytochrome oxidase small assembly protein [Pseudomonadota bacterium]
MTPEQRKANLKLGLILASVAMVFFVGFMVRMYLESH